MTISYPGSTGPFPASLPEPKAEPITIIALCDGSVTSVRGPMDWGNIERVMHANAAASDALVERIAKRVTEMQAAAVESRTALETTIRLCREQHTAYDVSQKIDASEARIKTTIDAAVQSALAEYDEHLNRTLSRRIAQAEARG